MADSRLSYSQNYQAYVLVQHVEEKLLWRAYRNSQTLFRTILSPTAYGLPQDWVFATPAQNYNRYYLRSG